MQIAEILWVMNAFLFDKYNRKHLCVYQCTRLLERRSDKRHSREFAKKYPHLNINELGNDLIWQNSPCDLGKS